MCVWCDNNKEADKGKRRKREEERGETNDAMTTSQKAQTFNKSANYLISDSTTRLLTTNAIRKKRIKEGKARHINKAP